jgi:nicotinate-nucleotide adenylyltransferase
VSQPAARHPVFHVTPWSGPLWAGLRVGLLGGSFNPAHDGHRSISLEALRRLRLDAVWWLVSPQNPLKARAGMASLAERLEEARRTARHPRILVTAIEAELGSVHTAQTLERLHQRFPRTRFAWLMGADNLTQIPRWHRWERIFAGTPVAVFNRPAYSLRALGGKAARRFRDRRIGQERAGRLAASEPPVWVFVANPQHPASATEIRRRRAESARQPEDRQPS